MQNFSNHPKAADAANYPQVSPNTLRNWVNTEKFASIRYPVSRYRLFRREPPDDLLRNVAAPQKKTRKK